MLRKINLRNFKCFDSLDLPVAPLTLLCGLNGMGKSSVMQSLLILRQSALSGDLYRGHLVLGGELTDIGTGQDALYEGADTDIVEFELHHDEIGSSRLVFEYSDDTNLLRAEEVYSMNISDRAKDVPPLGGDMIYINAERLGPRKFYSHSEAFARSGHLGTRGEYALNYIFTNKDKSMPSDDPRCVDSPGRLFLDVVDYWLNQITPGTHLRLDRITDADAIIPTFAFDRPGDVRSRPFRATNVGFGLSYTLPVITALLSESSTLCLIENPEAHLHPQGQTKLAELIARATLAGIQVIVETHSDHVMDGIRIAVREELIKPDAVAFHYFERPDGGRVNVQSPQIDAEGLLSDWPEGFFDQHVDNLARLLAPR